MADLPSALPPSPPAASWTPCGKELELPLAGVIPWRARMLTAPLPRPLDGGELRLGRAHAPARGPAAAPPSSSTARHGRGLLLVLDAGARNNGKEEREKERVRERRFCSTGFFPRRCGRAPWAPPLCPPLHCDWKGKGRKRNEK
jgi:hypothetical protein